jgi:WD40 repeat protein
MAGSNDDPRRTVRVWDVGDRKETHVLSPEGQFLWPMVFSADGRRLIAGTWRGEIKIWQLDGPTNPITIPKTSRNVDGLALLPDGQTLISAGADIHFWDVRTRRENSPSLSPRAGGFSAVALSPDGRRLAAGASDGRITLWDLASHQEVATLEGHQESVMQLAFTPEGDHLVSASKDQLRVWRAASRAEIEAAEKQAGK